MSNITKEEKTELFILFIQKVREKEIIFILLTQKVREKGIILQYIASIYELLIQNNYFYIYLYQISQNPYHNPSI